MRPVALLSDFGLADHYVGVMHAVLEREAPGVARFDLVHEVPPGDLWAASFMLRCAWHHLPAAAVVLAVVDPGVGTGRRAVAARVGERVLVAPDNGLAAAVGPAAGAVELSLQAMGLPPPSATFHGRDLFAPAAARLAAGCDLSELGPELDARFLVPCPLPEPTFEDGGVAATLIHVDRFGNLVSNASAEAYPSVVGARCGERTLRRVRTYGDADDGETVLLVGSAGLYELAANRGSAADALGLQRGDTLTLREEF